MYFSDMFMILWDSIFLFLYDLILWIFLVDFYLVLVFVGICEVDICFFFSVVWVFLVVVLWVVLVVFIVDGVVFDEELLFFIVVEVDCWVVFIFGEVGFEVLYIGEDVFVKVVDVIFRLNEKI